MTTYQFVVLIGLIASFGLGVSRAPWWSVFVVPVGQGAWGLYMTASEPSGYDLAGLGLYLAGVIALICLAAWVLGRGLRLAIVAAVRWVEAGDGNQRSGSL